PPQAGRAGSVRPSQAQGRSLPSGTGATGRRAGRRMRDLQPGHRAFFPAFSQAVAATRPQRGHLTRNMRRPCTNGAGPPAAGIPSSARLSLLPPGRSTPTTAARAIPPATVPSASVHVAEGAEAAADDAEHNENGERDQHVEEDAHGVVVAGVAVV